jgi:hypothetical protein
MNSQSTMVQYHALGLLYQIKAKDKLAVTKLVKTFSKEVLRSPFGHCLLVRYATQVDISLLLFFFSPFFFPFEFVSTFSKVLTF